MTVLADILVIPAALERPGIVIRTDYLDPVKMEPSYKRLIESSVVPPSHDDCWYAWAAGIFDGESHIGFHNRGGVISVHQASSNGVPQMLTRLHEMFGGAVYRKAKREGHGELQPLYEWRIRRRDLIENALQCVWPWLGDVKREQAEHTIASYVGPEQAIINKKTSAQRRWADPTWLAAHPVAVANAAQAPFRHGKVPQDPQTGRFLKGKLRPGDNLGLEQARATHCARGHEFTPDNIYWRGPDKKQRQCKTCTKDRARRNGGAAPAAPAGNAAADD